MYRRLWPVIFAWVALVHASSSEIAIVPSRDMPLQVAIWIARGLALGWVGIVATGLALPGGHPPLVFAVGYAVVLASFVLAPIGIGMAGIEAWRARRQTAAVPRRTVAILGANVLFLVAALVLTGLTWFAATRR